MSRRIGLDVHREFAQIAVWEDGIVRQAGQIATTPEAMRAFADSLLATDEVAIEATCNTHAIAKLIAPRVARVVISNPMKTRASAEAKVKTDKVDAQVLAQLLAADYLPSVWMADEQTQALRRQVARRAHIVRQRTRLKNQVQSILHRNLADRRAGPPDPAVRRLGGDLAARHRRPKDLLRIGGHRGHHGRRGDDGRREKVVQTLLPGGAVFIGAFDGELTAIVAGAATRPGVQETFLAYHPRTGRRWTYGDSLSAFS